MYSGKAAKTTHGKKIEIAHYPNHNQQLYLTMSSDFDYYDILGLKKEDNPNSNQIRRAYKTMARKHHPDLGGDQTQVCGE